MGKLVYRALLLVAAGLFFFATALASGNDSLKAQMIKDWQRAKEYTKAYLDKMPADKYGYRPVDSIRSFAEQMLHLAQASVAMVSFGTGQKPIFAERNLEKVPTAQSKDSVMYLVMACYDYCINALGQADASRFDEVVNQWNFSETKRAWLLKAFEHQTHHRGQCTIYIRLQGITPPNEMLF